MASAPPVRQLISVPDAAVRTSISRPTLYRYLARGEIEGVQVGRAVRLYVDSLEAFLQRNSK